MSRPYEDFIRQLIALEQRVKMELLPDGPVEQAPKQYNRFGIKWIWHNRIMARPVTVQCVVSDIDTIAGAWVEIEHKLDTYERPMDSWARRVFGEILVYVSPNRGKAIIFSTMKLRAAYKAVWRELPVKEIKLSSGYVRGIEVPWEKFCSHGTVVTIQ